MKNKNNLFIISGPSGAGEDSVIEGLKKDITIEFGVSQRSIKYVGGAGMLLIIIGVFMLLRHAGLI